MVTSCPSAVLEVSADSLPAAAICSVRLLKLFQCCWLSWRHIKYITASVVDIAYAFGQSAGPLRRQSECEARIVALLAVQYCKALGGVKLFSIIKIEILT